VAHRRLCCILVGIATPALADCPRKEPRMTEGWTRGGFAPPDWCDFILHWTSLVIEMAGVVVIVAGFLAAFGLAIRHALSGEAWAEIYVGFRVGIGRSLILGLEFLVAADIIGTVAVKPTIENLATLGLIVLIRSFLSFVLDVEITGSWPWQKSHPKPNFRTRSKNMVLQQRLIGGECV
jgi:uncharacterized membrane protein